VRKHNREEAEKDLDWAIKFWKKEREAIPTENPNPIRMEGKLTVKHYMKTTELVKTNSLFLERVHKAKIFKVHIEKAIFEELSTAMK
jgi:hypothetical protein